MEGESPPLLGTIAPGCIRAPMSESDKKATTVSRINLIIHYQWQAFVLGMFAKGYGDKLLDSLAFYPSQKAPVSAELLTGDAGLLRTSYEAADLPCGR